MLLKDKKIAIIGGGPGGLTLARLLQLQNLDVKVYERDLNKNARVQGSPLDLHENAGLAALRKAGLFAEFQRKYMPGAEKTTITNERAEVMFSDHEHNDTHDFGDEGFRPEIDRGVLRTLLLDSLESDCVIWDSHFRSMEKHGDGWLLYFDNGRSDYADMVIGSDGANSKIRPYLTPIKAVYSGITMLEGNIYDAENAAPGISSLLRGGKMMAFGYEKDILMGQKANAEIGFYASFKAEENWVKNSGINFSDRTQLLNWFKSAYADWSVDWHELFENAALPFIPRPIYCMPLDQDWEALSNLTLMGDAAHVMPPFAGEGVNMAMLDALELSECLVNNQFQSTKEAISSYERMMRSRAALAAKESLENGERMHSPKALATMLEFFSGNKTSV